MDPRGRPAYQIRTPRTRLEHFTIGTTGIAAIGPEDTGHDIVIAASTLPEFIRKAVDAYGSIRAAADGIGVPYSTLRGWLHKK